VGGRGVMSAQHLPSCSFCGCCQSFDQSSSVPTPDRKLELATKQEQSAFFLNSPANRRNHHEEDLDRVRDRGRSATRPWHDGLRRDRPVQKYVHDGTCLASDRAHQLLRTRYLQG